MQIHSQNFRLHKDLGYAITDHKSCFHNTPMLPSGQQIPFIHYSNIYFMPTYSPIQYYSKRMRTEEKKNKQINISHSEISQFIKGDMLYNIKGKITE